MLFKKKVKHQPDAPLRSARPDDAEVKADEKDVIVTDDTTKIPEDAIQVFNDLPGATNGGNGGSEDVQTTDDVPSDSDGGSDILKKYQGVDFKRMSKEKMFEVIHELLVENKKTRYSLNKYDSENIEFYENSKKAKSEKKEIEGSLLYLARKISPTYNKLTIENSNRKFSHNELIDLILKDHLSMQKELQGRVLELERQRVLDKKLLDELKNQFTTKQDQEFKDGKEIDKVNIPDKEIEDFSKVINEKTGEVTETKQVYSSEGSHVAIVAIDLDEARKSLGPVELDIMEIMGRDGTSLYPEILEKCINDKNHSESKVKTAFGRLETLKIINTDQVQTAKIKRGVRISELTPEIGRILFKEKFNQNPVESERSRVIKDHGNMIHGYSIRETGIVLESLGYYDVTTQRKTNGIHLGDNKYWIPDVIGTNPITNKKEYFEVEYGNHNVDNFDEKLTKANLKANVLRFIVPSEIIKTRIKNKVEHWKAMQSKKTASMLITIATLAELESKNYGIEIK